MSFWRDLLAKLSSGQEPATDVATSLVYVLIPESVQPVDRGSQYEDALEAELRLQSLGHISGGGSLLSDEKPDGSRDIIHSGIDIDAVDVEGVRVLLQVHLPELGCPLGTQVHYYTDAGSFFDELHEFGWKLAQAYQGDDPRFG